MYIHTSEIFFFSIFFLGAIEERGPRGELNVVRTPTMEQQNKKFVREEPESYNNIK